MQQPAAGDESTDIPPSCPPQASLADGSFYTRRCITEDPSWSLVTVPHLTELCIQHIIHNFESKWECIYSRAHGERESVPESRGSTRQADASERQSVAPSPAKGTDGEKYPLGQPVKQTV